MQVSAFRTATQNSLGARNKNPLNIRYSSANNWLGGSRGERDFVRFTTRTLGIRAGLILLRNYRRNHGIMTISGTINRFAPPNENNTQSYISFVASQSGLNANNPFEFNQLNLYRIVRAMCLKESGYYMSTSEFLNAWDLAFPTGAGVS